MSQCLQVILSSIQKEFHKVERQIGVEEQGIDGWVEEYLHSLTLVEFVLLKRNLSCLLVDTQHGWDGAS